MKIRDLIKKYDIPKISVAEVAGLRPEHLTRYLRNSALVSESQGTALEQAARDIVTAIQFVARMQDEMGCAKIFSLNLRDTAALRRLIKSLRAEEAADRLIEAQAQAAAEGIRTALSGE